MGTIEILPIDDVTVMVPWEEGIRPEAEVHQE